MYFSLIMKIETFTKKQDNYQDFEYLDISENNNIRFIEQIKVTINENNASVDYNMIQITVDKIVI